MPDIGTQCYHYNSHDVEVVVATRHYGQVSTLTAEGMTRTKKESEVVTRSIPHYDEHTYTLSEFQKNPVPVGPTSTEGLRMVAKAKAEAKVRSAEQTVCSIGERIFMSEKNIAKEMEHINKFSAANEERRVALKAARADVQKAKEELAAETERLVLERVAEKAVVNS